MDNMNNMHDAPTRTVAHDITRKPQASVHDRLSSLSKYDKQLSVVQRQLDDGTLRPEAVVTNLGRQRRGVRLRYLSLVFLLVTAVILVITCGYVWLDRG